jgi:hypothetical protein
MTQPYRSPRPVTRIALLCSYVDDARTSQGKHVRASTAYYRDSFTFLYVEGVRTYQGTYVRFCMACYKDRFTFVVTSTKRDIKHSCEVDS